MIANSNGNCWLQARRNIIDRITHRMVIVCAQDYVSYYDSWHRGKITSQLHLHGKAAKDFFESVHFYEICEVYGWNHRIITHKLEECRTDPEVCAEMRRKLSYVYHTR